MKNVKFNIETLSSVLGMWGLNMIVNICMYNINMEDITDTDYSHVGQVSKRVWEDLKWKTKVNTMNCTLKKRHY